MEDLNTNLATKVSPESHKAPVACFLVKMALAHLQDLTLSNDSEGMGWQNSYILQVKTQGGTTTLEKVLEVS